MKERALIKQQAKEQFKQRYWSGVGTNLLSVLLQWLGSLTVLGAWLLAPHIDTGKAAYDMALYRGQAPGAGMLFDEGFRRYGRKAWGYFLRALYILLWEILIAALALAAAAALILAVGSTGDEGILGVLTAYLTGGVAAAAGGALSIPGLVLSYAYSMTPFLLADRPELTGGQAVKLSRRMMKGYKAKLFWMDMSYLGWYLLTGLTAGFLGVFYVVPYYSAAKAGFYVELSQALGASLPGNPAKPEPVPAREAVYAVPAQERFKQPPVQPVQPVQRGEAARGALVCTAGEFVGARFPMAQGASISIGRSPSQCQIVLREAGHNVSRLHCRIRYDAQTGRYGVTDFSTNGTYLAGGQRLTGGREAALPPGTELLLDRAGTVAFKLQ